MQKITELVLNLFKVNSQTKRVLVAGFLAFCVSHVELMYMEDMLSSTFSSEVLFAVYMSSGLFLLVFGWCFFSSSLDVKLVARQIIMVCWGVLIHRLFYGLESAGSMMVVAVMLIMSSAWVPFVLFGISFDELQLKINEYKTDKKNHKMTVITGDFKENNANR